MNVYLVEQITPGMYGRYLTEAVVLAETEEAALKTTFSVADAFGLTCRPSRLGVTLVAEGAAELARHHYRWTCKHGNVLAVGEGWDDDGLDFGA